jgi:hypothetical protein
LGGHLNPLNLEEPFWFGERDLQIEVCAARDGGTGGAIVHSKISIASRSVRSD